MKRKWAFKKQMKELIEDIPKTDTPLTKNLSIKKEVVNESKTAEI
jgi:hypothetical protein